MMFKNKESLYILIEVVYGYIVKVVEEIGVGD